MPRVMIEARELTEAKVDIIAMVKRGANRMPFRIVKSDEGDMIDLAKIGRGQLFKSESSAPAVTAVVLDKSADRERITGILKAAGIDASAFKESAGDGTVVLSKSEDTQVAEGDGILKLNDQVAVVITDLKKGFSSYSDDTDFGQAISQSGFFPGVYTGFSVLQDVVSNIMYKAEDQSGAAEQIQKAVTSFGDYVVSLVGKIPVAAFKADVALAKASEEISANPTFGSHTTQSGTKITNPAGNVSNDVEGSPTAGNATPTGVGGGKQPQPGGPVSNDVEGNSVERKGVEKTEDKAGTTGDTGDKKDDQQVEVQKATGMTMDQMLAALKDQLTQGMDQVTTNLKKHVDDSVGALRTEVTGLQAQVKKTEEAINGTVPDSSRGDNVVAMGKSGEGSGDPPLIDTSIHKISDGRPDLREVRARGRR